MPTNRVPINRRRNRKINAAAIDAFKRCRAIIDAGLDEAWEEEGGRRRECLEAQQALRMALNLPPWAVSPADPGLDGPMPDYMRYQSAGATWPAALELRRELEAAARQ